MRSAVNGILILLLSFALNQAGAEEAASNTTTVNEAANEAAKTEAPAITQDPSKPVPETLMYEKQIEHKYSLFAHRRTYVAPISYVDKPSQDIYSAVTALQTDIREPYYQNLESEFQISFFVPVVRKLAYSDWDLNVAYTHHSWWQVYNSEWSKPFRETNYTPEVFFRYLQKNELKVFGLKLLGYDVGYMHQSNGQIQLLSRSWDRIFGRATFSGGDYILTLAAWARMPELGRDDNPEILKYMGLGEVLLQKNFGQHSLEIEMALAEFSNIEITYSYPWKDGFRWYASFRGGTSNSLIEFDRANNRIALGVTLDNFYDYNPARASDLQPSAEQK